MLEVVDDELGIIDIDEAIDIIRDKLDELAPEEEEVIIFSWPEVITPEDKIQPYLGPNLESPGEVLPYDGWFFWVDYYPYAGFAHPTLYVFVDPETGEVSTSDQEWWPLLNGEGLWVNTIDYWDEANWAFSWVEWRPLQAWRGSALRSRWSLQFKKMEALELPWS